MEALKPGDRPAYEAANRLANDAFGQSFLHAESPFPRRFCGPPASAWPGCQHRFLEIEFPLPFIVFPWGISGFSLILFIAAYSF